MHAIITAIGSTTFYLIHVMNQTNENYWRFNAIRLHAEELAQYRPDMNGVFSPAYRCADAARLTLGNRSLP
jgi:hypothetical protein